MEGSMTKAQKIMKSYDRKWVSMRNKNCYDRKYAIAHLIRETAHQVLPHNPKHEFTAWKQEMLQIADEIEALQ